ncbi:hypothetical protein [Providencia hangzhouensis]|uniref:hypothetical protein n=1 Tax=Providencia hangzhouensis TaxID=3031799 RepID=UPI0034DDA437
MNILKPLILSASLIAISFSTFAYPGDGNGSWHRGGYQNQHQYNDRPCDNYRHSELCKSSPWYDDITSIQTAQPD